MDLFFEVNGTGDGFGFGSGSAVVGVTVAGTVTCVATRFLGVDFDLLKADRYLTDGLRIFFLTIVNPRSS